MKNKILMFAAIGVSLSACGGGVSTPDAVRGKWGADCSAPTLQIDASALHILYPQVQDVDLTASEFDGTTLKLSLVNEGKKITDVYTYADNMLTPRQVIVDGATFNGDKIPLSKCGG